MAALLLVGRYSFPSCRYEEDSTCHGQRLRFRRTCPSPRPPATSALHPKPYGAPPSLAIHAQGVAEIGARRSKAEQLMEEVAKSLSRDRAAEDIIQYVDELQDLGIAYHFKERIGHLLDQAADSRLANNTDLFHAAQRFRVLRHNGYDVSPDLFHKFLDNRGQFKDELATDWRGLLSLYEASYYGTNDEEIMTHGLDFSMTSLNSPKIYLTPQQLARINDSLKRPRHEEMERFRVWRRIKERTTHITTNPSPLLELAALDYQAVQLQHQQELAELTKWWTELRLARKMSFVRDRPLEFFLWAAGIFPDPTDSVCRMELARFVPILLLLDALYDNYGSLEELTLFTGAIKRWDLKALEDLPEVMKLCYLATYNLTNEVGYKVLVKNGDFVIYHLRNTLVDMCEAFLLEAKWLKGRIIPRVDEYIENGIVSTGTYVASLQAFFLHGAAVSEETLRLVTSREGIFSYSGKIFRLWNDLATFKEEKGRGEVASIITCCKEELGLSSDDDARREIRGMIHSSWKDLNQEATSRSPLPHSVFNISFNLARTSQAVYQPGDDPTVPSPEDMVKALFFKHPM